jgi:hypothetical protein
LDNAPAHPRLEKICSREVRIKCLLLPPDITALFQSLDQGVIPAFKRMYQKKFLEEIMVVLEEEADKETDTQSQ